MFLSPGVSSPHWSCRIRAHTLFVHIGLSLSPFTPCLSQLSIARDQPLFISQVPAQMQYITLVLRISV